MSSHSEIPSASDVQAVQEEVAAPHAEGVEEVLAALIISTAIGDLVQAIQDNTSAVHAVAESMHRG